MNSSCNVPDLIVKLCNLDTTSIPPNSTNGLLIGAAMEIYTEAARVKNSHFNLLKAVDKLKCHGYNDFVIYRAIEDLCNYQFIVPSGYGLLGSFVDSGDPNYEFPMVGFIRDNSLGRGEVLSELTGQRNKHVKFTQMRSGVAIERSELATNW